LEDGQGRACGRPSIHILDVEANVILRLLVFLLALASGVALAHVAERPRTIRVVLDNAYAPYSFQSSDGKVRGILVDQWRAWEKKTGRKVEIQAMDWDEALRRMRMGDFDVIDTVVETPERRAYFDFTPPYATVDASIFFREDISGIADLASLKGFPVAITAGDQLIDRLRQNGVTTVIPFNNEYEIIEAAKRRKINIFVTADASGRYWLSKAGIAGDFQHSAPVSRDKISRAVRKGDATTLRLVTEGFAAIEPSELAQINEKWIGRPVVRYGRYVAYAGYAVALAILLIAGLAAWNRSLKKGILQRTAELTESELRLRQITENIHDVFWMATPSLDEVLYLSPEFEKIWGRSRESVFQNPQSGFDAIHVEARERVEAAIRGQPHEGHDLEFGVVRPDGTMRWIRDRGFPVRDASGKVYRIAGISQDLTEQKQAEEAVREAASQLEALSRRLVALQEFERKDLARELHDRVGQSLTALNINLSILAAGLPLQASDELRARLADSEKLVEQTTAAIRDVVTELRPPMIDDQGLAHALDWYAAQFSARTGVAVSVRGSKAPERPAPAVEIALFRIAQEALNNVTKHARAKRVEITLGRSGAEFVMAVEDDGVGFDVGRARVDRTGLGIVTMRERAQAVGGRFEVQAMPGRGTRFTVWVPAP